MRGTTLEVQSFKVIQEMVHNEQEATGSAVRISAVQMAEKYTHGSVTDTDAQRPPRAIYTE